MGACYSCVGISEALYEDIRSCETPWMCRDCSKEAATAVRKLPLLKDEVELLRAENTSLKEELKEALSATCNDAFSPYQPRGQSNISVRLT